MKPRAVLGELHARPDEPYGDPRVRVAVLDGPVDLSHPCFAGADLTRLDTLVQEPAGTGPMSLHGTHVASLLFGTPGSPVTGLVPRCSGLILPVFRDGGDGRVPQMDLARAIERAVEEGAHVINISGGERTDADQADALLTRALRLCEDRGVLVVSAVGNDGADTHQVPAAVPSVLAVGAAAADGRPLDISNWGADYRSHGVLAPGQDIEGAAPGGGLTALTGSSFATPLVAGTAALLVAAQLAAGGPADPKAAGQVLLATATAPDCADPDAPACRRGLGGSLDAVRAHALITRNDRNHWNDRNEEAAVTTPAAAPTPSEAPAPQVAPAAYETPAPYGTPAAPAPMQPVATAPAVPPVPAGITADGGAPPPVPPAPVTPPPVQAPPTALPPAAQAPVQAAPLQAAQAPVQAAPVQAAPAPAAPSPAPAAPVPASSATAPPVHAPYISTSAGVRPSCGCGGDPAACACGGAGNGSPRQLIYAIGTIGFDYPTEARRDSFRQSMPYVDATVDGKVVEQIPDPYSPRQLRDYLATAPWVSDKVTWTLTLDGAAVYALEAEPSAGMDWSEPLVPPVEAQRARKAPDRIATEQGKTDADLFRLFANPPVSTVYRVFRDAIAGQALNPDDPAERDGYISRVSVPGVLTNRTTRLFSGQIVPVVEVKSRGLYTWNEAVLVDLVFDQVKKDAGADAPQPVGDKKQAKVQLRDEEDLKLTIRSLLDKIYYQFRNLGQTSADRALNFMGTNAFLFGDKISEGLLSASKVPGSSKNLYALDTITVTKSPYCRVGSDCQDVTVTFYDPEDERRSRLSYLFTIDVSDELPVTLAPVHKFLGSF
ncbi:S8 family serine peptidase [Streptomyces sp. NPDC006553]|uniref:cyanobactin maturation protease PatG family protein n=1 Tax=Streptomyces sp. NPDC006553 TaxID=3157180 RepID=UPI0033B4C867